MNYMHMDCTHINYIHTDCTHELHTEVVHT